MLLLLALDAPARALADAAYIVARVEYPALGNAEKMLTVGGFAVFLRRFEQSALAYPAHVIGYLLRRRDFYTLQAFNGLDEVRRVEQCVNGARVEPREASAHKADIEIAVFEIYLVYVGYLKLAALGGLERFCVFDDPVVVEIESRYSVVRLRMLGLFDYRYRHAVVVEFDNAEALRILDIVAENSRSVLLLRCLSEQMTEAVAVEQIVAEHHGNAVVADEVLADYKSLGESLGLGLDGVGEL